MNTNIVKPVICLGLRSVETKSDLILYLDKQGYTHLPGAHKVFMRIVK